MLTGGRLGILGLDATRLLAPYCRLYSRSTSSQARRRLTHSGHPQHWAQSGRTASLHAFKEGFWGGSMNICELPAPPATNWTIFFLTIIVRFPSSPALKILRTSAFNLSSRSAPKPSASFLMMCSAKCANWPHIKSSMGRGSAPTPRRIGRPKSKTRLS